MATSNYGNACLFISGDRSVDLHQILLVVQSDEVPATPTPHTRVVIGPTVNGRLEGVRVRHQL